MNDETQIPLLEDLIEKGEVGQPEMQSSQPFADLTDVVIEDGEMAELTTTEEEASEISKKDEISEDANIKELLIDEEIRMILDKHMDNAYNEIIRLLNHKIS